MEIVMKALSSIGMSIIAATSIISLSSCAHFTSARVYGECNNKFGGGGECKVGAEAKWESGGGNGKESIIASILSTMNITPDAGSYELDTSGSTIPYPSSGTFVVSLKNSSTDVVQAAKVFAWVKTGSVIRASDPDAINDWAYANAGTADAISYELLPFASNYGSGQQTIAGQSKYEGSTQATFSANFDGGSDCIRHPSPHLCMQQ